MFGDEISIDPSTLIELERETRIWSVCCACGITDSDTEANLRQAGWILDKQEYCPYHNDKQKAQTISPQTR